MRRSMFFYRVIEHWLCKGRLISFVVSESPITIEIDNYVSFELLSKIHRQSDNMNGGFRIIPVHVKDGNLEHLRHIRGIHSGSPLWRRGGKSDLIIDNDMQRPADMISVKLAQIQSLLGYSFSRETSVAMY